MVVAWCYRVSLVVTVSDHLLVFVMLSVVVRVWFGVPVVVCVCQSLVSMFSVCQWSYGFVRVWYTLFLSVLVFSCSRLCVIAHVRHVLLLPVIRRSRLFWFGRVCACLFVFVRLC